MTEPDYTPFIDMTPEMIAAGVDELREKRFDEPLHEIVQAVFYSMLAYVDFSRPMPLLQQAFDPDRSGPVGQRLARLSRAHAAAYPDGTEAAEMQYLNVRPRSSPRQILER